MARRLGATDAQLDAVSRGDATAFEPSWAAALRMADVMTPTPGSVSDEVYAELARHWAAAQIVEIIAVICLFAYFNRFAHALAIPVTT